MTSSSQQPIFIHGCGFHSALGSIPKQIHQCLAQNHNAQMQADTSLLNNGTHTIIGRVTQPLPSIPDRLANFDTRNNRLALSAIMQITSQIEEAKQRFGHQRIAVIIGSSTSGIADGEIAYQAKIEHGTFPEHYHYRKQELGNSSQFIAAYFGLTGPCYTISTACSSSGRVFVSAKRLLQTRMVDAVIVGGVDTLCRLTLNGFNGLEALSNQHCQPFSADRNGINIGEA
ncbi:MAG: beta-ketoacyl synthase N-terminal-like domain-containing protein, partial [Vibrio sp.]